MKKAFEAGAYTKGYSGSAQSSLKKPSLDFLKTRRKVKVQKFCAMGPVHGRAKSCSASVPSCLA